MLPRDEPLGSPLKKWEDTFSAEDVLLEAFYQDAINRTRQPNQGEIPMGNKQYEDDSRFGGETKPNQDPGPQPRTKPGSDPVPTPDDESRKGSG